MKKVKSTGFFVQTKRFGGVFAHHQAELGVPAVNNKSNRGVRQMLQLIFRAVVSSFNYPKYEM